MKENTIRINIHEYRELIELKGRVKSAMLLLDADEYAPREVLKTILKGEEKEDVTKTAITREGMEDALPV